MGHVWVEGDVKVVWANWTNSLKLRGRFRGRMRVIIISKRPQLPLNMLGGGQVVSLQRNDEPSLFALPPLMKQISPR